MELMKSFFRREDREVQLDKLPLAEQFKRETGKWTVKPKTETITDETVAESRQKLDALLELLNSSHQESL